jgi:hypothetical protein
MIIFLADPVIPRSAATRDPFRSHGADHGDIGA